MKKYIIIALLIFSIVVPATSFAEVASTSQATTEGVAMPPLQCYDLKNNLRYRDRDSRKNGEVTLLQNFLRSKNYIKINSTGYFGVRTLKGVKDFQKANSIRPTGFVGSLTRAKIKALTCGTSTDGTSVTISGVSGPQALNLNQQGTWTVTASSTTGGNLSYSVFWGDEVYTVPMANSDKSSVAQQSATFNHSYTKAGIYTPTFTVTSANTINCITTPCPSNAGSAKTSLTVKVGDSTPSATGYLYIEPSTAEVTTGYTKTLQAMYQPPAPACLNSVPACLIAIEAPYPVKVTWTSSDTKIATIGYKNNCPPGAYCFAEQLDYLTAVVGGVAEGTATITAEYKDESASSSSSLKASVKVSVKNPIR